MTDLRKLHEEATPGPWVPQSPDDGSERAVVPRHARLRHDAALIAATRNALPFLLDVVEAARMVEVLGCEASRWADEEPPVWDRCLDPDYVESRPNHVDGDGPLEWPGLQRCGPCSCHNALSTLDAHLNPEGTTE